MGVRQAALHVAAAAVCAAAALHASPAAPPWAGQVDRLFQQWDSRESPGCAAGVFDNGAVVYARGYGMADLEHDAPIAPATVFYVGSLAKQFTAFGAALAIQQGTLAAGDSVRKYVPELPAYADAITIADLVHHTSGLRDYYALLAIAGRRWDELWDNGAVLRMAARQKHLNFEPGTEYSYSNTGYALLAIAIERATKTPFAEFMDANVFRPLGMTSTLVHDDASRLIKGRAIGYEGTAGKWTLDTPHSERTGAGGLYTTIPDLQRWDENFYTARVGGPDVVKEVQTPARLKDGKEIGYAWGLEIGTYRGLRIVEHSGALGGYRAHVMRFPAQHTSVAVLCNLGRIVPSTLAREVADLVLASNLAPPTGGSGSASAVGDAPPDDWPADLSPFTGAYWSDELQSTFVISSKDGSLFLQRDFDAAPRRLALVGGLAARAAGFVMHFQRDASGLATGFLVGAGPIRGIEFRRR